MSERAAKESSAQSMYAWLGILGALVLAAVIAWAGSQGGVSVGEVPLFAVCVAGALVVQWIAFIPAYIKQTEAFFDLTGSVTFVTLVLVSLAMAESSSLRSLLIGTLTILWALRLGVFLTARLRSVGFDRRFRSIKPDLATFLMTWTLQGLWVALSLAPGLAAITSPNQPPADAFLWVGLLVWAFGYLIEVVADEQKRAFRRVPENEGRFIDTGLWAWCQHPNYFGEIVLWTGVAIMAFPVLEGWQHVTLISPVFVWLLLTRISGVRMLDASAKRRWGDDPEYVAYRRVTPVLVPRPPKSRAQGE